MSSFTTNPASSTSHASDALADLIVQLQSGSEKQQLQAIDAIAQQGEQGYEQLLAFLQNRPTVPVDIVAGKIYQVLHQAQSGRFQETLQHHWPQGLVPLQSANGIDYSDLQSLLVEQQFEAADRLTLQKLCELAGPTACQRKWLYFTEVNTFPVVDLQTIDTLWRVYSEGKFGFSVQRELWLSLNRNWEKLWPKIEWKSGNIWTRYPNEFTWDMSAPRGHLPLSNQLRGVRVMEALLSHSAWTA